MQTMKIGLGKQARGLTLFHDRLMLIIIAWPQLVPHTGLSALLYNAHSLEHPQQVVQEMVTSRKEIEIRVLPLICWTVSKFNFKSQILLTASFNNLTCIGGPTRDSAHILNGVSEFDTFILFTCIQFNFLQLHFNCSCISGSYCSSMNNFFVGIFFHMHHEFQGKSPLGLIHQLIVYLLIRS